MPKAAGNKKEMFESMPVPKALMSMAVPTIISQLITLIYNMVDAFFIGQTGNSFMVAAISLTLTLVIMLTSLSNLFGVGGGSLTARLMGVRQEEEAKRVSAFSVYGAIAVALSHKAELLVLDEPTSGLDPVVRDEVVELFSEFTRDEGHAVLISSHIVSDLEKLCDYIAFLHQGRLLLCEEKDALCEEYGLAQLSAADFAALDPAAVVGSRRTPYGVTAIVRREALPEGFEVEPVSLEDLFVVMVKGEEKA